ncbi:MAG: ParB/RepB/Spo0J family partition protein [Rhodothermales bacterium]
MASKKAALGRGLSAILPSDEEDDEQEAPRRTSRDRLAGRVAQVDVSLVRPNPYQPRKDFNDSALDELAESIKQLGVIQPITVRTTEDGFEIISGERRLRAARRAGLSRIPAYVREADSEEMLEMAIVENIQREELNPIEVALGYQRLIDECSLTQEGVAEKVGKGRATIANFLRLLKLPARIQASLRDGMVSVGHARALINVDDEDVQQRLIEEIEDQDLSVRDVEKKVRRWHRAQEEATEPPKQTEPTGRELVDRDSLQVRNYTTRLRNFLSTQVKIRHKSDGGHIEIEYYSNEDLERLLELILEE